MSFTFYLGTPHAGDLTKTNIPLFVSIRTLRGRTKMPRALGPFILDSGGFTELNLYGKWNTTEDQYIKDVRRVSEEVGNLVACAPMDWMNEGFVVKKTGLSVEEHLQRTVQNFVNLKSKAPDLPWMPVVQGYEEHEYLRCLELYEKAGVDLRKEALVGAGTMCRRQGTQEAHKILAKLHAYGLSLHALGFKKTGLVQSRQYLASSDSMAWCLHARKNKFLSCGGEHRTRAHNPARSCSNCLTYGLQWRDALLADVAALDQQLAFSFAA